MNQEVKTKWIQALRSGDYVQGREELRSNDMEYCCLGVLCDLVDPNNWNLNNEHNNKEGYPTQAVLEKAGIPYNYNDSEGYVGQLVEMNDDQNYDFNQIADWIEENL